MMESDSSVPDSVAWAHVVTCEVGVGEWKNFSTQEDGPAVDSPSSELFTAQSDKAPADPVRQFYGVWAI